jgi:hypothetical protein
MADIGQSLFIFVNPMFPPPMVQGYDASFV